MSATSPLNVGGAGTAFAAATPASATAAAVRVNVTLITLRAAAAEIDDGREVDSWRARLDVQPLDCDLVSGREDAGRVHTRGRQDISAHPHLSGRLDVHQNGHAHQLIGI